MADACDGTLWRNRDGYQGSTGELTTGQIGLYAVLRTKAVGSAAAIQVSAMPGDWRSVVMAEEAASHRT